MYKPQPGIFFTNILVSHKSFYNRLNIHFKKKSIYKHTLPILNVQSNNIQNNTHNLLPYFRFQAITWPIDMKCRRSLEKVHLAKQSRPTTINSKNWQPSKSYEIRKGLFYIYMQVGDCEVTVIFKLIDLLILLCFCLICGVTSTVLDF